MKDNYFDIVVVGAGILGISHAYHCARVGLKVALVEKHDYPREATARNFGQIVPSGFGSRWQNYGRSSLQLYKQIQQDIDISVRGNGSIYLAHDEEEMTLLEELHQINQGNGYDSRLLNAEACCERYAGIRASYVLGGLFFPEEVTVDPLQLPIRLIQYLRDKYQVTYIPNTLVTNVESVNGLVHISSHTKTLKAEKAIICSGTDFQSLFPEIFQESDLVKVKIQMMATVPNPNQQLNGSILTGWTIRRYEAFTECPSYRQIKSAEDPMDFHNKWGIHILFKQRADGSIILGDTHEYFEMNNSTEHLFKINEELNDYVIQAAQEICTLDNWRIAEKWIGYYCQCQHNSIFNRTVGEHIQVVTGIGGKGMTASLGFAKENIEKLINVNITI